MNARQATAGLLVGSLLFPAGLEAAPAARAAPASVSWTAVEALPPGTRVSVVTIDGRRIRGLLVTAAAAEVVVQGKRRAVTIPREAVRELRTLGSPGRKILGASLGAFLGLVVGAVAGAFVGLALDQPRVGAGESYTGPILGFMAGMVLGAILGGKLGKRIGAGSRERLLYRAP